MLKVLHNHIFATKLRDVFTSSPLVLVYQTVGGVDAAAAAAQLQGRLDAALPDARLAVRACRMRNSVAAGAGEPALEKLFQASNILVGFGPAAEGAAAAAGGEGAAAGGGGGGARAGRRQSVGDVLGSLFGGGGGAAIGAGAGELPHKQLAKAFQLAAALPGEHPLVLLGAFYGRRSIQLRHLKEWVSLDERKVHAEMLSALEAPLESLLALDAPAEALAAALDAAGPHGVLAALDVRAASEPAVAAAAAP
ncbi:MAG: hypothetical protein J3K34DRAFT_520462 [Monoraphidium minutum]|nr:MAG: hypothetical protein J3K34DRAFT_520462 [Monoraphidium minutum]